jgi:integrase
MSGCNEHVLQHRRTGMFWFRRVVPERLRPVLDDVPGFPAKPGRRELTVSLRTKDRREAHIRAAGYVQAVGRAFAQAEALVPRQEPPNATPPRPILIRPQEVLAAIAAWQRHEIARRELHYFNNPPDHHALVTIPTDDTDPGCASTVTVRQVHLDAWPIADRQRILYECLVADADWPAEFDASLAAALASEGLPVPADHPAVARLRRPFAEALRAVLRAEEKMLGENWSGPGAPPEPPAPILDLVSVGEGFFQHVEAWGKQLGMKSRQSGEYLADVKRFASRTPGLTVGGVEKSHAREWVKALAEDGRAGATIERKLSALRSYWKYLQAEGVAGEDAAPFAKVALPGTVANRRPGLAERRQPFQRGDVVKLWRAALDDDDKPLADLIQLAAYSGGRIESLCQLTKARVPIDSETGIRFFQFGDKTDAGVRKVPVHPAINAIVDRLIRDSRDGFLVRGRAGRRGGERSVGIGKRFGRLKRRLGYGRQYVFHSIRKTVATLLENSRCPESTAADILGHDKPTMTYGLYSGGSDLKERLHWVSALDYPDGEFSTAS